MNKSDLKTGMVIELNDGMKFLVLLNTPLGNIAVSKEAWMASLDGFNHKLIYVRPHIVRVYKPTHGFQMAFDNWNDMELIWEREPEIKELTLQEIADKFGIEASQLRIKESEVR